MGAPPPTRIGASRASSRVVPTLRAADVTVKRFDAIVFRVRDLHVFEERLYEADERDAAPSCSTALHATARLPLNAWCISRSSFCFWICRATTGSYTSTFVEPHPDRGHTSMKPGICPGSNR